MFSRNHEISHQNEQSKSFNENKKKNLIVDGDDISLSNVFTLKKVEMEEEIDKEA